MEQNETPAQLSDRMLKAFIIGSYVKLLEQMLPQTSKDDLMPVAEMAEQAMTEVQNLIQHDALKDKVYALCPLSEANAKVLHVQVCTFASNVMGALVQKGKEIVEGSYTVDDFFNPQG